MTPSEIIIFKQVINDICILDNRMGDVVIIAKTRQSIIFKDEYNYMFLVELEKWFKENGTHAKTLIGSLSIYLNNCTVKIKRAPEPK